VRYAYYDKLRPKQQAIYRRSDAIETLPLPSPAALRPLLDRLETALRSEQRAAVERAAEHLSSALLAQLGVRPVRIKVLSRRPSTSVEELHGLYEPSDGRARPLIKLWMRTAEHKRLVAFRTFVRTLLHELCHHLDYELLKLEDSFHTAGFFKRESSLFKQLVPAGAQLSPRPRTSAEAASRGRR
jgi:hypothetical protein